MPTDWEYHADGVGTALQAHHSLNGELDRVDVELDGFKVREWTEDEVDSKGKNPSRLHYDEETDVYVEHAAGSHVTVLWNVDDNVATLESIEPEDGDTLKPQHMTLLPAAERLVSNLNDVHEVRSAIAALTGEYQSAVDVVIERLET